MTGTLIENSSISGKFLVVLDFDDTIVVGNSEENVKNLLPKAGLALPHSLVGHYEAHKEWNKYINLLYKFVHENGISRQEIESSLEKIDFVPGSKDLLKRLTKMKEDDKIDCIVISGGNTLIIEYILQHAGLSKVVDKVLSNPAQFTAQGLLEIGLLNTHDCTHCFSDEMCKGVVITDYLSKKSAQGVQYNKVFFCGDYLNDICLCLELRENDVALARHDFPLHKDLINRKAKGQLKSDLFTWKTGLDVIHVLEKHIENS